MQAELTLVPLTLTGSARLPEKLAPEARRDECHDRYEWDGVASTLANGRTIAIRHIHAVEVANFRVDGAIIAHEAARRDGRAPADKS